MEQERLFGEVAMVLDAELLAFERLEGGSSANVWRLDLRHGDNDRAVVFRQHESDNLKDHDPGVAGKEYQLQQRLNDLGFPVAQPLYLDETNGFLVTEFVQGSADVATADVPSAIAQMAELLVRIHSVDLALVADAGLGPLEHPLERLTTCLPPSPQGAKLGALLESGQIKLHANLPVLMHGDYWPGNVLWADGSIAALIDWEDACLGDPLADLACARVELLCMYGHDAMERFTARYLELADYHTLVSLPIWEAYVSASALATMHLWGLDNEAEASRRATTHDFFATAVTALLG